MNLHEAIKAGNTTEAINLINEGADIEAIGIYGETPLHSAAGKGHVEIVNDLLRRGADVHAIDKNSQTPLHYAVVQGHVEIVNDLLGKGADVNAIGFIGNTPLHSAASNNHTEVVNILLDRGANINATNYNGWTALHFTAARGGTEVVNLLLERGAHIEDSDQFGGTALYKAALFNNPEVIETLINHGANTDAISNNGETPLICAIENKHFECILNLANESTKEFIELSTQNDRLRDYLHEQLRLAISENTRKSGIIENIKNFINYITKTKEQKRIETSMRACAKALFGQETTLKAKALLKIKIGVLSTGVKDAYINTLRFLYYFIRFDLTAENINHIIGYVGLYDAKVDLNDILSDLSPKLSRDIQNTQINTLVLNQASKASRDTPVTCCCTISQ